MQNASVQFTAGGTQYSVPLPDAQITWDSSVVQATTAFDTAANVWVTRLPWGLAGNTFATGAAFTAPVDLPAAIDCVTWTAQFSADQPGFNVTWKSGAATYRTASAAITPRWGSSRSTTGMPASTRTPTRRVRRRTSRPRSSRAAHGGGGTNYTGGPGGGSTVHPTSQFTNFENMIDWTDGPNSTFGFGGRGDRAVHGLRGRGPAQPPDHAGRGGAAGLRAGAGRRAHRVSVGLPGETVGTVQVGHNVLNQHVGAANAGPIYVDVTAARLWQWSDFTGDLQLVVDQRGLGPTEQVYYDAVGLRVTSQEGYAFIGPQPARTAPATACSIPRG